MNLRELRKSSRAALRYKPYMTQCRMTSYEADNLGALPLLSKT
jgi:hypothetical protein